MTSETSQSLKNVVIIGISHAGSHLIENLRGKLPSTHRIVAIDKQPSHFHVLASLRASVIPGWEKHIHVPVDKMVSEPSVMLTSTTVTKIASDHVEVDRENPGFSTRIPFDILIIATGSIYPFPARWPEGVNTIEELQAKYVEMQKQLAQAKSVLVIGGGAVGCEYAAEVGAAYPDKKVTLVHAGDKLWHPAFSSGVHTGIISQLEKYGVQLHLNTRLEYNGQQSGKIEPQNFELRNGETVEADFVLLARGNKPNGQLAATLSKDLVDSDGFILVKPTLQIASEDPAHAKIFVVGDAAKPSEPLDMRTAVTAMFTAAVVAPNVINTIKGKPLKNYKRSHVFGVIALGPEGGLFQIAPGVVFGPWLAKRFKSRELLTPMVSKRYRATPAKDFNNSISAAA